MEGKIVVKHGTDVSAIELAYPDIYLDDDTEGEDCYFVGKSMDDPQLDDENEEVEWLTYEDAVKCCGFCDGAVEDCETTIEGNGAWAQGMLRRRDFSGLAVDAKARRAYKTISNLYVPSPSPRRRNHQGESSGRFRY